MTGEMQFSVNFVVPSDDVILLARENLDSENADKKIVAKALLDATDVSIATRDALGKAGNVDLAVYFDHWFGDAIESATRLLKSEDNASRYLAKCLIDQEQSVIKSRADFLEKLKQAGGHGSAQ